MSRAGLAGGDDSEMGLRAPRERYWDSKRYWKSESSPHSHEHSGRWEAYSELKSHITQHVKPPQQVPEVEHQTHQKSEEDATHKYKGLKYAGLIFTSGLLITLLSFALLGTNPQTSAIEATGPDLQQPEVHTKRPAEISKFPWFTNVTYDMQLRVASYASTALKNTLMLQRKGTEGKPAPVRRQLTGDSNLTFPSSCVRLEMV
ncbi:hypothetical protein CYMTET_26268 [Cymbomonas tetramitiformis]|uniref:Uncharacterized protein n=1 Tax=Cymbomonas tetramitiformis TaxID=36881 RepID=A0AAE0KY37_9CHLO|nr:hypothetical protein CYMTET_26268 [Cymbomonas tetramitiformis]